MTMDPNLLNWTPAWVWEEFQKLHAEHQEIMTKLDQMHNSQSIIPELEAAVSRATELSGEIDRKVPDEVVTPKTRKKKT